MKPTELFNSCKTTLRHKASWKCHRFLCILMTAFLFYGMNNSQVIAASLPPGANTDTSTPSPGSDDRFNAASFLKASNPDEADQHWTWEGEVGAVMLAIAGIAAVTKGYHYYHDERTGNQAENQAARLRESREENVEKPSVDDVADGATDISEESSLNNSERSAGTGDSVNFDSDIQQADGNDTISASRALELLKEKLTILDGDRKKRESARSATSASSWRSFFTLRFSNRPDEAKQEEMVDKGQQLIANRIELMVGDSRTKLTSKSDIEEIKFTFIGDEKRKLNEVLNAMLSEDGSGNEEEEQRKFAFFAAKKELSTEHLNGYLEALSNKKVYKETLEQMKLLVDAYWTKKEDKLLKANAVSAQAYPGVPTAVEGRLMSQKERAMSEQEETEEETEGSNSDSDGRVERTGSLLGESFHMIPIPSYDHANYDIGSDIEDEGSAHSKLQAKLQSSSPRKIE